MSCRRAQEIDLPGFLEAPREEAFEEFRAHYPRCRECAAEVRAWTELRADLRAVGPSDAHPAPEALARYEADPSQLAGPERAALAGHLARCAACRDELRALRAFDPAALAAAETAPAPQPARLRWLRSTAAGLGRVAWHPATAYAVALSLLVPLFFRGTGTPPLPLAQQPPAAPAARLADTPAESAAPEEARAKGEVEAGRLASRAPGRPAADTRARAPAAPEPLRALGYGDFGTPEAPAAAESEAAAPVRRQVRRFVDVDRLARGEVAGEPPASEPRLVLREGAETPLPRSRAAAGVTLRLPLPAAAPEGGGAEVGIVGPRGRRELRERRELDPGVAWVDVEVPPGWLARGVHRVSLRRRGGAGDAAAPALEYPLRVE